MGDFVPPARTHGPDINFGKIKQLIEPLVQGGYRRVDLLDDLLLFDLTRKVAQLREEQSESMQRLSQIVARRQKAGSGTVGEFELKGALLELALKRINGSGFHSIAPSRNRGTPPSQAPWQMSRLMANSIWSHRCEAASLGRVSGSISANPIHTLTFLPGSRTCRALSCWPTTRGQ